MSGWWKTLGRGLALAVWLVPGADAALGGGVPFREPVWMMRGSQCGPAEPTAVRVPADGSDATGFDLSGLEVQEAQGTGTLVAIGGGTRSTGGYRLALDESAVTRQGRTLRVRVTVRAPPEDAMVTQALTRPCGVLRLPEGGGLDRAEVRLGERTWRFPLGAEP
ncbi:MAG: protease complex subunit PrcB family protein [Thiohalorhabdus sp.]|uniref:protease complex subunit PrcB family protein n=1 Tax=Thiohalorhabdus sp. TaxID=3094134 RepID=UPI00397ECF95